MLTAARRAGCLRCVGGVVLIKLTGGSDLLLTVQARAVLFYFPHMFRSRSEPRSFHFPILESLWVCISFFVRTYFGIPFPFNHETCFDVIDPGTDFDMCYSYFVDTFSGRARNLQKPLIYTEFIFLLHIKIT